MSVIERPHSFCFSKNEVRYVFQLTDVDTRPGLFLQARIMYAAIGAVDFTELITFDGLLPDGDGKVYLYIQNYLDSICNYVLPTIGAAVSNADDQCKQFYIEWREVEDANQDPEYENEEGDSVRIVIKGGIERHKNSRNNFFINYMDTQKPFLTWQPENRFVYPNEPIYLSFLNVVAGAAVTGSIIKITKHFADGTETIEDEVTTADNLMIHCVPLLNFAIDAGASNKVVWFEVSVYAADDTTLICTAYRMYIEYRPIYESYVMVYHGSLGGMDFITITGDTDISYKRSLDENEGGFSLTDWTYFVKTKQQWILPLLQRNYKGVISNNKTRTMAQKEALVDLFTSRSIYMAIDSRFVPVVSLQTGVTTGRPDNLVDGLPVEWQLSENNEVFTPASAEFGAGTDTETYG